MAKAATSKKLKAGFQAHLKHTRQHVARLETIFKGMKELTHGKHCSGMEGLIKEGSEVAPPNIWMRKDWMLGSIAAATC